MLLIVMGGCSRTEDRASSGVSAPESATMTTVDDAVPAPATLAEGTRGMVSSAHPLATRAGIDILAAGGNAFDAAVAVAATLNVVEPMMSGMGGYGTILIYSADEDRSRFLNSSGLIPRGLDSDVFRAPTPNYMENRRGAKSISTPGNVNAWKAMSDYGRLSWNELFDSAINHAENGYIIDERIAGFIANSFEDFSDYSRGFYGQDGVPLETGDRLVQTDLAASLQQVRDGGAEVFHGGAIGEKIDAAMQEAGSFLRLSDLAENEPGWWEPIEIDYRGHRVVTASPPANSFPALVRLGLMSQFDVADLGHNTVDYLHTFAEATKHGYWTRMAYAGDPDIAPPPLGRLLSAAYFAEQAEKIGDEATPFVPPGLTTTTGKNTTHFVVADQWGNVVSATQTLGNSFGSRIMAEGTGIWLNNSLAYSTYEPKGNPMDAFPGRRKLSGDVPMFVMQDDKPWVVIGTPGGHTIGQTVPQIVMNILDFNMNVQDAISAPRVSFIEPDQLALEPTLFATHGAALTAKGHNIEERERIGNAHGLTIEYSADGAPVRFTGGADTRGTGAAQGL